MTSRPALLLVVLAACNKTPNLAVEFDGGVVDADHPDAGAFPGVVVLPNLDDDDANGERDDESRAPGDGEDDLGEVVVPADAWRDKDDHLVLALDGDGLRVWSDGVLVLSEDGDTWPVPEGDDDVVLQVEATRSMAHADLVLTSDGKGEPEGGLRLAVTGAPLLLDHHLQPAEAVWVMSTTDTGFSNASMVEEIRAVLGDKLHTLDARRYRYDVWVQDEPEMGTFTAPDRRMDFVLDSVRDRGLDGFPESLWAPGVTSDTWGDGRATSYDSFGNLDTTPPVEGYPYGRTYYGAISTAEGPVMGLREGVIAQAVQEPFTLDTSWLCVGHVDEFTSFVPDPTAPRGFRLLVTDTREAYALFDSLDPASPLPRYGKDFGYATVGELAADTVLRTYNLGLQDDKIEPNISRFRNNIGLTDDEIVRIPGIFERVGGCGAAALIPGTVNLLVADVDGQTHVFAPDPFFRADDADESSDPFIAEVVARLPPSLVTHFVDNWEVYHLGLGEVHCGINVRRTPYGAWWEDPDALGLAENAP